MDKERGSVIISDPRGNTNIGDGPRTFTFDHVFDSDSTQQEVYTSCARPLVDSVLGGYNGTIFAYGQTGTGKTHSMEGDRNNPQLRGIIPNAFEQIFSHIKHAGAGAQYLVRASYLEIYNEEIWDLLSPKAPKLEIKERTDTGVYVKDLSTHVIKDVEEAYKLMAIGNQNRSTAATNMNARSSRSHSIFTITVECAEPGTDGESHIRVGKLNLVDLAGSERQSKTGATGDRLKEAAKINLSLTALGNVISALVDGKSSHIPYRDSKLTRLLQDSLGGNSKTMMIATLSPASYNYDETLSTLRYANRAKNIKNKPKINEDPKDAMLREFQDEINRLKAQLENFGGEEFEEEVEVVEETGSEDEYEDEHDGSGRPTGRRKKVSRGRKSNADGHRPHANISEMQLAEMQNKVEAEKKAILESKDILESEKARILDELQTRAEEIERERNARDELTKKLAALQEKLLVGGVSLLDKSEEQQMQLAKQAQELETRKRKEWELQKEIEAREEAQLRIEGSYASLQEEASAKTKNLKKLWNILMRNKAEIKDIQEEWAREKETLLDTIRELSLELKSKVLVINAYIPPEQQGVIEEHAQYDDMSEKWNIDHVAFAGNNIKDKRSLVTGELVHGKHLKRKNGKKSKKDNNENSLDAWSPLCVFRDVYLTYDDPKISASRKKDEKAVKRASLKPSEGSGKTKRSSRENMENSENDLAASAPTPVARGLVGKKKHYV